MYLFYAFICLRLSIIFLNAFVTSIYAAGLCFVLPAGNND